MIRVSRLDGSQIVVNAELIELVEATPDTHLSLTDGKRLIVRESTDDVVERVIAYRRRAYPCVPRPIAPSTAEHASAPPSDAG
jgi:flagellar protein FlbD